MTRTLLTQLEMKRKMSRWKKTKSINDRNEKEENPWLDSDEEDETDVTDTQILDTSNDSSNRRPLTPYPDPDLYPDPDSDDLEYTDDLDDLDYDPQSNSNIL